MSATSGFMRLLCCWSLLVASRNQTPASDQYPVYLCVQTLCSAVVQVYRAERSCSWVKRCCGVACLVKDNPQRSYFIRVFDIKEGKSMFEQELYHSFSISCPRPYFITFAGDSCQVGLNFASEEEAKRFRVTVSDLLNRRQRKSGECRRLSWSSSAAMTSLLITSNICATPLQRQLYFLTFSTCCHITGCYCHLKGQSHTKHSAPPPPPPPPPPGPPPPPELDGVSSGRDSPSPGGKSALLEQIRGGAQLKKVEQNQRAPASSTGRDALLDQIRQGIQLKTVSDLPESGPPTPAPTAGIVGALMEVMQKRSKAIHSSDDDEDEDEDDDFEDDEEWDD
uniref:WASP like actin nucleation promoting factor a n=1 Tax=Xiphophorus couchianus TaxID=32473 RepID=A0A3B5LBN8_9TELE